MTRHERPARHLLMWAWLLLAIPVAGGAADEEEVSESQLSQQAQQLVQQLGSRSFLKRKQAMNELVKIGLPALNSLEDGALSDNREISYRCDRVLLVVRELDLQRRLLAFLRDTEPDKYELPGWPLFRAVAGEGPDSKLVFVEMQKADAELMRTAEGSGKEMAGLLMQRLVVTSRPRTTASDPLALGRTGAILFAAGDPRVPVTQQVAAYVHRMVSNSGVRTAMTGNVGTADVMRKLLSRWLRRQRDTDPYVNLLVALQFDLKESLGFSLKVLEGAKRPSGARRVALQSLNRFGDSKHAQLVERFLTDTSVVSVTSSVDGKRVRIQLRDIALATLITLRKQDHRKFGFPHIRFDSNRNFHLDSLYFASEEDRLAAFTKWKEFEQASKEKKSS